MTAEETLIACQRAIDYEAQGLRMWFDMCNPGNASESELRSHYQNRYNQLVVLRQKMNEGWIAQMLNRPENDPPPALLRIFLDGSPPAP